MSAIERLEVKLGRVLVPAHTKVIGGQVVHVDAHWRSTRKRSKKNLPDDAHIDTVEKPASPSEQAHEAMQTIGRASVKRPSDAIDFRDDRKSGPPITVHPDELDAAIEAAGVQVGPNTVIKVRIRPQRKSGQQGEMRQEGPDQYRLKIRVVDKPVFEDRHLYVLNNSLVHELRHVTQAQADPNFHQKYVLESKLKGYHDNAYEIEAREYGRLADHTGKKDTGKAGTALGKKVWGLR